MVYLDLFITFFRIGALSFGGGLAMLPVFLEEVKRHHWMTENSFMNMVAVSEVTPGAMSINIATYIGSTVAGWPGAIISTTALILPAFLVIVVLTSALIRFKNSPWKNTLMFGLRSLAAALIFDAGWLVLKGTLQHSPVNRQIIIGLILMVLILAIRNRWPHIHPAILIFASALTGAAVF